jgi:hypothetical protein
MAPFNHFNTTTKRIIFSGILIAMACIELFLFFSIWIKEEPPVLLSKTLSSPPPITLPVNYDVLLRANAILSDRLKTLQQSDQQYADALTEANGQLMLDSINRKIYTQEEIFRGSIDSIFLNTNNLPDSGHNLLFENIINSYKSILENRHSTGRLRNAININKKSFTPDASATLKLTNELEEKNGRIASLESTLKSLNSNNRVAAKTSINAESTAVEKEDEMLLENKLAALTAAHNNLKQDYERVLKQQSEISKTGAANEQVLKNTASSLQEKVKELNAELSLARVDCNISRADAAQIISNAKQRKQLLSEASGILDNLGRTTDAGIKRKVNEKILRLNQVAANSRD